MTANKLVELSQRNMAAHKHAVKFRALFNLNLQDYWNLFWGFDIVKLNKTLKTPDGVSCKDHILRTKGQEAVDLVMALLSA